MTCIYKHRILIVDDDISVFEHATTLLSSEYEVSYSPSGAQAVDYFNEGNHADLILMDIMMPNMDGYVAMEAIRQISACRSIPVIFLTGANEPSYELKALKSGAKDFISKPFDSMVFLARIELCIAAENPVSYELVAEIAKDLSATELLILKYIAKGHSNEDISKELHYSYGYIKQLVSKIFEKLAITSRKELKQFCR